jgi:hypothetical protein
VRCVDIDAIRTGIAGWAEEPDSKRSARELGFTMAAEHLAAGHDVVLPQLLIVPEVIERIERIAHDNLARHVEIILLADHDDLAERLRSRPASERDHPRDLFTDDDLIAQTAWSIRSLGDIATARPTARVIDVSGLTEAAALDLVAEVAGWA